MTSWLIYELDRWFPSIHFAQFPVGAAHKIRLGLRIWNMEKYTSFVFHTTISIWHGFKFLENKLSYSQMEECAIMCTIYIIEYGYDKVIWTYLVQLLIVQNIFEILILLYAARLLCNTSWVSRPWASVCITNTFVCTSSLKYINIIIYIKNRIKMFYWTALVTSIHALKTAPVTRP